MNGGLAPLTPAIIWTLMVSVLFLAVKNISQEFIVRILKTPQFIIGTIWIMALFPCALLGWSAAVSLVWVLWGLVYITALLAGIALSYEGKESAINVFSNIIIAYGVVTVFHSFFIFFTTVEALGYPRLNGPFLMHNVFASFIIFPLCLSFGRLVKSSSRKYTYLWSLVSCILLVGLIFTFSRGAGMSLIISAGSAMIACFIFIKNKRKFLLVSMKVLPTLLGAGILSIIIFYSASSQAKSQSITVSPYPYETKEINGITYRLNYFKDALKIAPKTFPFGVGPTNYETALQSKKSNFEFYSANPHNIYLQMLVEMGVGAASFYLLIITFVFVIWRSFLSKNSTEISLAIACGAFIIHTAVEVSWTYPVLPMLLFFCIGLLVYKDKSQNVARNTARVPWQTSVMVFSALLVAVAGSMIGLSATVLSQAKSLTYIDAFAAETIALQAQSLYPWHPQIFQALSQIQFVEALNTSTSTEETRGIREEYVRRSLSNADRAVSGLYCNADALMTKARILYFMKRDQETIDVLKKVIMCNQTGSHEAYIRLAQLYYARGEWLETIKIADDIVPRYTAYIASPLFLRDPIGNIILKTKEGLVDLQIKAKEKLGTQ